MRALFRLGGFLFQSSCDECLRLGKFNHARPELS
jgi:hypothetical protein